MLVAIRKHGKIDYVNANVKSYQLNPNAQVQETLLLLPQ